MDLLYKRKESILKKKDGVLTNGGFEKQKKQKKKKTFSGLSESLTRFTMMRPNFFGQVNRKISSLNMTNFTPMLLIRKYSTETPCAISW